MYMFAVKHKQNAKYLRPFTPNNGTYLADIRHDNLIILVCCQKGILEIKLPDSKDPSRIMKSDSSSFSN